MRLHRWITAAVGVLLIVTTMFAVTGALPSVSAAPAAQSFSATIEPMGGLVQFLASGETAWKTISKVTLVGPGDQIRTGNDGAAVISVVTGIKINVYPTTLLKLNALALGSSSTSGLTFTLSQLAGLTYTTIAQKLKPGDSLQVITPSVIANIRGTKFYTFVSRIGNTGFIGEESPLQFITVDKQGVSSQPDNIAYFRWKGDAPVCTVDFLKGQSTTIITEAITAGGQQELRDFLVEFLVSNLNSKATGFLATFLGLPSTATQDDIFAALKTFNKPTKLADFLNDLRSFMQAYYSFLSTGNLPPATCGNGQRDAGETADNCPTDVADLTGIAGNSICETEKGESLINSPADCDSNGELADSCVALLVVGGGQPSVLVVIGNGPISTPPATEVSTVEPTLTPTPTLPPFTPPVPSGAK